MINLDQVLVNLLDSAYITTFDSFALSVVKKYHYLINLSNDIGIIDSNVIAITKNKIIDKLFLELYEQENEEILKLIKTFCINGFHNKEVLNTKLNIKIYDFNDNVDTIFNNLF